MGIILFVRLTHIKLAGFKSFADPTTILTPGQRVGIVGPNGCGKSNVIDAVRWVLGESSARQLRGESMQDVIFSGSVGRQPINRASVELFFNNNLGRAPGQWSVYAEIAVKRVLHRDGESGYYINNLKVRRRDITDIFLGTGLGPRAYAIVEQGMISRIIDARPEELRIFLEEAAGVSKYKERRRETELRLRDARDNLLRVNDIRQEMAAQLQRLDAQAQVAQRYHELQRALINDRNLLTYLKKREAAGVRECHEREVRQLTDALEAEMTQLRQAEACLVQQRVEYYAANDTLQAAQGALYEANAEAAQLEQELKHQRESRLRLTAKIEEAATAQVRQVNERAVLIEELACWRETASDAQRHVTQCHEQVVLDKAHLPQANTYFQVCRQRYDEAQRALAKAEQMLGVEETHLAHHGKSMARLQHRQQQLQQENAMPCPLDEDELTRFQEKAASDAHRLEDMRHYHETVRHSLDEAETVSRQAITQSQQAREQYTRLETRLRTLQQWQSQAAQDEEFNEWLVDRELDRLVPLWRDLQVEPGWEGALESILRERIHGLVLPSLVTVKEKGNIHAPSALTLAENGEALSVRAPLVAWKPLAEQVRWRDWPVGRLPPFLSEWLDNVYYATDQTQGWQLREQLPFGAQLVCPDGGVFTRYSVSFYGGSHTHDGVLVRQREIQSLEAELAVATHEYAIQEQRQVAAADELSRLRTELVALRQQDGVLQQHCHRQQMDIQKWTQQVTHWKEHQHQTANTLRELIDQWTAEQEQAVERACQVKQQRELIAHLDTQVEDSRRAREESEATLVYWREVVRVAEHNAQEAIFHEKTAMGKVTELEKNCRAMDDSLQQLADELELLRDEQAGLDEMPLQAELQAALTHRQQRETELGAARATVSVVGDALRHLEETRLQSERCLDPLRDRLSVARLNEQESQLLEAQFNTQLSAVRVDEAVLMAQVDYSLTTARLQRRIDLIGTDIDALGAVNLVALEELERERARKTYLDAQAADLDEAANTLTQAIHRIDREKRDLLQRTFDQVNQHLGELFPMLFGGGHARLVLTGEEILDAGIQIIAQPPGKKNSTLHLLSGGEKALTALSLTFSLFRLNPAPFCLLDEVDAPLDDANTGRFCELVNHLSAQTQFLFISHNKITMELAQQLVGVTMMEQGVSRVVSVDVEEALQLREQIA